jgi:hypothetical protein
MLERRGLQMHREFTFTKRKLEFIVRDLLERDVLGSAAYRSADRAEEGFEKRAALEFLLWFVDEAFPENFSFRGKYDGLENEYESDVARQISAGRGWSGPQVREKESADNVVFVDFRNDR